MQRDNKINDLISIELKNLERLAKEMKKIQTLVRKNGRSY